MQRIIYVGLDMGSSRCQQTVIKGDGSVVFSRIVPTGLILGLWVDNKLVYCPKPHSVRLPSCHLRCHAAISET